MRPIMIAAELAGHKTDQHYSLSDDGYDDMEVAARAGWTAIAGWGQDGWDLGDWPYVVISTRTVSLPPPGATVEMPYYEMRQTIEGDTTAYRFTTREDREAAIDFLFVWYGIGKGYDEWEVAGLTSREALDAGTLRVPAEFRGPYRHARSTGVVAEASPLSGDEGKCVRNWYFDSPSPISARATCQVCGWVAVRPAPNGPPALLDIGPPMLAGGIPADVLIRHQSQCTDPTEDVERLYAGNDPDRF